MPGLAIDLVDVYKTYDAPGQRIAALDGVSLVIPPGAAVALTGPSGSGKSTLLHLLGAMDAPTSGSVHVGPLALEDLDRKQLTAYRRTIGFVFQSFHLLPALTALDNVLAPVLPRKVDFDKRARAAELLAAVGLAGRQSALPSQLSGGQQQRVAIARALINGPTVLLADEPTGNLDGSTGTEILDLILRLRKDRDMTVVLATHDLAVAGRCDNVFHLRDGKILNGGDIAPVAH